MTVASSIRRRTRSRGPALNTAALGVALVLTLARAPGAQDGDPAVDDRPEWPGDGAQPQPRDDGRYSTSDAPDFGD